MDWIDRFLTVTKEINSPEPFRLWSAITAISGVLERRIYTRGTGGPIYPNLFSVLVGVPGSGKTQIIRKVRDVWMKIPDLKLSPDNVTKASLINVLGNAMRMDSKGSIYSALNVACSEFGVFFVNYDTEFISTLNNLYDSPDYYEEQRIVAGIRKIDKPHLVILSGTQPDYIHGFMPEEAWGMGFAARIMLVFCDALPPQSMFAKDEEDEKAQKDNIASLGHDLIPLMDVSGPVHWTSAAMQEHTRWALSGGVPIPVHAKLLHYITRRPLTLMKLSMISGISRTNSLFVDKPDVERGISWLLAAEKRMPDIFEAVTHRTDSNILEELSSYVVSRWRNGGDKEHPVANEAIYDYLSRKVHVERIPRIIHAAEQSGHIRRGFFPDEWLPREAK